MPRSLRSAMVGICANTAPQPLPRVGCAVRSTHPETWGRPHPARSLPDREAQQRRLGGSQTTRRERRPPSRISPPQPLLTPPLLVSWRTPEPRCQGFPSSSYGNRPGNHPAPWRSLQAGPRPFPGPASPTQQPGKCTSPSALGGRWAQLLTHARSPTAVSEPDTPHCYLSPQGPAPSCSLPDPGEEGEFEGLSIPSPVKARLRA